MTAATGFEGQDGGQSPKPAATMRAVPAHSASQSAAKARRLLNFAELQAKLNVSERTARKIVAEPWMPDPIELGPRALRWVESEVDEAIAARAPRRAEPDQEPAQLLRGKVEKLKREGVPA